MNTPQNTHETLRDDLKAFADRELSPWRRLVVRRHLARCEACQQELKTMEKLGQDLAASRDTAPLDATLRARLLESAPNANTQNEPQNTTPFDANPRRVWPSKLEFGIAGAVMTLLVFATLSTLGKKVQTVFNVANNALTTDDGYLPPTFSAPEEAAGAPALAKAPRLNTRNLGNSAASSSASGSALELPSSLRRVHKEARIGVAVQDAEAATDAVVTLVRGSGGFIAGITLTSGEQNSKTAALELRVPVARFETILGQIGKLGEVQSKNISGEDITAQVSDANEAARILSNDLSIREAQIRARKQRATRKTPFALSWEQRSDLRTLRIQAAQSRARLELLKKTSELSNISVQLLENARPVGQGGFVENISETGHAASQSFLLAARLPIQLIIWILAYSPLWLPALLAWRYFLKKERQRTA